MAPAPTRESEKPPAQPIEILSKTPEIKDSPCVLVADDDPTIRAVVRLALKNDGFTVIEAKDGIQTLNQVAEKAPSALILDLNMPKLEGKTVIGKIRQGLSNTRLSILVLTSSSDDKSQEETIKLGADDYLTKPVDPSLLITRVKAALHRKRVS